MNKLPSLIQLLLFIISCLMGTNSYSQSIEPRDTVQGIVFQFELEDSIAAMEQRVKSIMTHEELPVFEEELDLLSHKFHFITNNGEMEKIYKEQGIFVQRGQWCETHRIRLEKIEEQYQTIKTHINRTVPIEVDETAYVDLSWSIGWGYQKKPKKEQAAYNTMFALQTEALQITKSVVYDRDTSDFTPAQIATIDDWLASIEDWQKTRNKVVLPNSLSTRVPVAINFQKKSIENEKGKRIQYWAFDGIDQEDYVVKDINYEISRDVAIARNGTQETLTIQFHIKQLPREYLGESVPESKITIEWNIHLNTLDDKKTYTRFDLSESAMEHYPLGKTTIGKGELYNFHNMFDVRALYGYKIRKDWVVE